MDPSSPTRSDSTRHFRGQSGERDASPNQLKAQGERFVLKMARTDGQAKLLANEAAFYLNALEGFKHAPEFFGYYRGVMGGSEAICLLLEYCGGGCVMDRDEFECACFSPPYMHRLSH